MRPIVKFLKFRSKIAIDESDLTKSKLLIISFTGGMGAQILSAAILFHLKLKGYSVKADLDYFKKDLHVATTGNKGEISHWDWQLDDYGLTLDVIKKLGHHTKCKEADIYYLPDGHLKMRLAMQALNVVEVKEQFRMPQIDKLSSSCQEIQSLFANQESYICIHIRRGDYVNVASHIVSDDAFILLAKKFKHLVDLIVIVSDSLLGEDFKDRVRLQFRQAVFLDNSVVSPFLTHCVMRNSSVLVCSNSQYSLSAGVLNEGLVVIPKLWLGFGNEKLKVEIEKLSDFSVLS